MSVRTDEIYLEGLDFFSGVVARLAPPDWARASPCTGWRALDVLGHVGAAVRFGTALLLGEQPAWEPAEQPGDAVEGEPATWWAAIAGPSREAVAGVDLDRVVDSPMGRRTVAEGLSFPALDLFVHGWDLARAAGTDVEIPERAIAFARATIDPVPEGQVRRSGVFAAAVDPPAGATPTEAFVAWTGWDPRRTP